MAITDIFRRRPVLSADEMLVFAAANVAEPPNPRKVPSGTSYSAKGSIPVDQSAKVELGSAAGGITREVVPELTNRSLAIRTYDQMANNDAAVDVSLRAGKMPIMGATFFVEAFDEKEVNADIAEFVSYNLLEGQSAPFLLVLEDILRMYEYGFSILEKVYELREWAPRRTGANRRQYTMLKKLAPRPTPTIKSIDYDDNGGPIGVTHGAVKADGKVDEIKIPIDKIVIFSHNKKGGNLEGKSLLRTAYKHWYYKDNLYKIDGIQKERHGMGFPTVTLPPNYTQADKTAAQTLVKSIRTNEEAGAVLPPGFELKFADIAGQPVNVMESIDHHNAQIMLNVMVQFLLMGISQGGGRATSGSHQDMFTKSLRYVANLICQIMNLYVVPQLVAYNFDTLEFPEMQVRNIGETKDLQQWASAFANLLAQNAVTMDVETEQWVREILDAPFKLGGKQTPEANASGKAGGGVGKGGIQATNPGGGNNTAPVDNASGS